MAQLVHDAITFPWLREYARKFLGGLYSTNYIEYVQAIDVFLRTSTLIVDEPEELLIHPIRFLREAEGGAAMGDCDDIAMAAASLLAVVGIPVRFKAIFPHPGHGHYQHVFTEYNLNGLWRAIDPTIRGAPVYDGPALTVEI